MFKKLIKNRKAQQTAEYALLISLVVAAVIAMQTYAQRTIQGRIRDAGVYLQTQTTALGTMRQYEPYYLDKKYDIDRSDTTTEIQNGATMRGVGYKADSTTTRKAGGASNVSWNGAGAW
jgi:uncharacterized protein (UPF0333 family)